MDELIARSSMIKSEAIRLGFNACGISHAEYLREDAHRLRHWLNSHHHAGMSYMENHFDGRTDPARLVEGARSVISVLLGYYPSRRQQQTDAPVISIYAYGKDYHDVIRGKLNSLLKFMQSSFPPVNGRGFVDSAPVLDRAWAARSGLGWIGKNTNLISPEAGSYFFIGSLIVDIPLTYDKPIADFCGDCNRCIRACPTAAIVSDRIVDARRCISYLTIENKGEIGKEFRGKLENRAFGCDICQEVCPWNHKAVPHQVDEFKPLPGLLDMTRQEWYELNEDQFREKFSKSALKRTKFSGLKRNLMFIKQDETSLSHDGSVSPPR